MQAEVWFGVRREAGCGVQADAWIGVQREGSRRRQGGGAERVEGAVHIFTNSFMGCVACRQLQPANYSLTKFWGAVLFRSSYSRIHLRIHDGIWNLDKSPVPCVPVRYMPASIHNMPYFKNTYPGVYASKVPVWDLSGILPGSQVSKSHDPGRVL